MNQEDRLRGLDGLRAISILAVMFHHASPRPLPSVLGKGAVGVDLFFVLSGYLITRKLLHKKAPDYRGFYFQRALRILPLYYLALLGTLLVELTHPAGTGSRDHLLSHFAFYLSFTSNWFGGDSAGHPVPFAHSWSLCVEQQFYLFWPALLWSLGGHRGEQGRPRLLWPGLVLAGWIALDLALEHRALPGLTSLLATSPGKALFRVATSFSLPIAAGCLLALIEEAGWLARARVWLPPALLLGLGLGLSIWALSRTFTEYPILVLGLSLSLASILCGPKSIPTRLLDAAPLRLVGRVSYALYLSHFVGLAAARSALALLIPSDSALDLSLAGIAHPTLLRADVQITCLTLGLGLGPSVALAWLLHRFVEVPCIQWARSRVQQPRRAV